MASICQSFMVPAGFPARFPADPGAMVLKKRCTVPSMHLLLKSTMDGGRAKLFNPPSMSACGSHPEPVVLYHFPTQTISRLHSSATPGLRSKMTGSASQAMDVIYHAIALFKGRSSRRGRHPDSSRREAGG